MIKDVILQGGQIKCPICGNQFNWSYKMELINIPELERKNKIVTTTSSFPHKCIAYIATLDGNIRFVITCERCRTNIETESMELINKENYEKSHNKEISFL